MQKNSTSFNSPLSPTHWPDSAFSPRRIGVMLLALAGAGIAAVLLAVLPIMLDPHQALGAGKSINLTPGVLIGQFISYAPILAAVMPLLPYVAMRTLSELGLRGIRWRDLAFGAVGAVGMYAASGIAATLQNAVFHIGGKEKAVALFGSTHDPVLLTGFALIAVFCAPFVEEFVFRGFVLNALLRYLTPVLAIVIDGILFGLIHLDAAASFPLACAGMVLAVVYYRTGSLVASMFSHGMFNFISVVLVLAGFDTGS